MAGSKVDMLIKARDQASPALAKVDKKLAGLEMSATGLMTALGGGYALARVAEFTWEMGKLGAESLDTKSSFESMMKSVGQSTSILDDMRRAAGDTISDLKLMQGVNTALANTTGKLSEAMADAQEKLLLAARAAHKINPALGSVEYLYQSLNIGIKRNSKMLIDNALITFSASEQQEKLAKSLGKSVKALTEEEQKLALLQGTLEGADRLVAQLGGDVSSAGDAFAELDAVLANLKATSAEAITPATVMVAKHLIVALGGVSDISRDLVGVRRLLADAQKKLNEAQEAGNLAAVAGWQRRINDLQKEQTKLLAGGASTLGDYVDLWARVPGLVRRATEEIEDTAAAMSSLKMPSTVGSWFDVLAGAADYSREPLSGKWLEDVMEERRIRTEGAEETAAEINRIWEDAYRDQRSTLESIMQPTQSFDATGMLDAMDQHVDTWDEAARRMADVANQGADSPWAKMLDIPEDVLAAGGDKLKGYAASYVRDFYLGLHAGDIDKEAIKEQYKKMLGGKEALEAALTEIQKELGGADMSLLRKAAGMRDPAQEMISTVAKGFDDGKSQIEDIGDAFGTVLMEAAKDTDAVTDFVIDLAARVLAQISKWGDEE